MQIVKDVMMELGIEFKTAIAGGASDGNFVSDLGVPTIDGLGPVGGMMCSPEEYLDVASLTQRCSMLALIIKQIGTLGGRMHD
jgi:glutamate carboxypeptidase